MIHLVLGGARSGKSSFAEQWCIEHANKAEHTKKNHIASQSLVYVATATAFDDEMKQRISHHQQTRAKQWQLIECPLKLTEQINTAINNNKEVTFDNTRCEEGKAKNEKKVYLVDCLTLWLNNVIFSLDSNLSTSNKKAQLQQHIDHFIQAIQTHQAVQQNNKHRLTFVFVSNEVGLGVIPMGEATRLFVDYAGWLNQAIARIADQVTLVTAGIPLTLKGDVNA